MRRAPLALFAGSVSVSQISLLTNGGGRTAIITRMAVDPTPLERAFALARTGDYAGMPEIRAQLKVEGYEVSQLVGRTLLKQLRLLCDAARHATPDRR
jgi:hypothetical protein